MSPLEQLILKKKQEGASMDPMEQKAKLANLQALKAEMHGMMKDRLAPAKVEVEASSPEALEEGLDQAQEVVEELPGMEESVGLEMEEAQPLDVAIEGEDSQDLTPEELALLQKLLLKAKGM